MRTEVGRTFLEVGDTVSGPNSIAIQIVAVERKASMLSNVPNMEIHLLGVTANTTMYDAGILIETPFGLIEMVPESDWFTRSECARLIPIDVV